MTEHCNALSSKDRRLRNKTARQAIPVIRTMDVGLEMSCLLFEARHKTREVWALSGAENALFVIIGFENDQNFVC